MNCKYVSVLVGLFLLFVMMPCSVLGETEYNKEINKCAYALEDCCNVCLKTDVDAKVKPVRSKVEECVRECDYYDDLCKRLAIKLHSET